MADRRITELSAVSAINVEVDLLPIVSGGTTKKITAKSFAENIEFLSYQGTDLKALSANWQNTYTTVEQNSANWENSYTVVAQKSANWDNSYTEVSQNSANWQSTYSSVNEASATWQDTSTVVQTNSAIWGAVEFNNDVTYTEVLSGLNEVLRLNVNGLTRYIRLFDIGPERYLFGTESGADNIVTEDSADQLLFNLDPEIFWFGTEDASDIIVGEEKDYKLRLT